MTATRRFSPLWLLLWVLLAIGASYLRARLPRHPAPNVPVVRQRDFGGLA